MIYITNALPGLMIASAGEVKFVPVSAQDAAEMLNSGTEEWVSAVGHKDTAAIVSGLLGIEVAFNRTDLPQDLLGGMTSAISGEDNLILACLYDGPRLPEGTSVLPEGAQMKFFWVGRAWIREGSYRSAKVEYSEDGFGRIY